MWGPSAGKVGGGSHYIVLGAVMEVQRVAHGNRGQLRLGGGGGWRFSGEGLAKEVILG